MRPYDSGIRKTVQWYLDNQAWCVSMYWMEIIINLEGKYKYALARK